MKNKLLNNFALKILAVVFAILFWLIVLNISDYTMTVHIDNIQVDPLNGDTLEELDQIYDIEKGETVDIIVKGRRSVVSKLDASDFYAYADLSQMSITNSVQIFVVPKNSSIEDDINITYVDNTMSISLEDKVTGQYPIKVNLIGDVSNGYYATAATASPNIVSIEGPKSAIGRITEVSVDVRVDGRNESFKDVESLVLIDAYGDVIESDRLIASFDEVEVNVDVYPTKEVNVVVETTGKPNDGYGIGEVTYQPQTVKVAGSEEATRYLSEIRISDVSVTGLSEDYQTTVDLMDYLPKDVTIAQNSSEIAVNVAIEPFITREINVSAKDISFVDKAARVQYSARILDSLEIKVTGLAKDVEELTVSDFDIEVDCSKLSIGDNKEVSVNVVGPDGVKISVKGYIAVTAKEY